MNQKNHDEQADETGQQGCCGGHRDCGCEGEPLGETDINDPIAELEAKLADAEARALRALADFQNYQRRAAVNEIEARKQGITSVLTSLLPVMDNFDLALGQDISSMSAKQLLGGVEMVRAELQRALANQGVTFIRPARGDDFDPLMHEAVTRHPDQEVRPGAIVDAFQTGYKLGDRVLRPAKVVVSADRASEHDGQA